MSFGRHPSWSLFMSTVVSSPPHTGKAEVTPEVLLTMPDAERFELVDGLLVRKA